MIEIYQICLETRVIPLFRISLTPGSGSGWYFFAIRRQLQPNMPSSILIC